MIPVARFADEGVEALCVDVDPGLLEDGQQLGLEVFGQAREVVGRPRLLLWRGFPAGTGRAGEPDQGEAEHRHGHDRSDCESKSAHPTLPTV